jgi:YVTN family beta-propeller protein
MQEAHNESPQRLRLFLCHSSVDKSSVRTFYQRLQNDKFDPWLDEENLLPGQDWEHEIKKAVRGTDVVLVCLSRVSVERAGFANKEIKFALDVADEKPEGTIFIIPVKLEECNIPDRLRRWHWVNLFEERGYEKLLRALQERANKLGATIPPTLPAQFFYAPSASAILITPDSRDIYCADEEHGKIVVIENIPHAGGGLKTKDLIDLNRSGSAAHPQRLALNPDTNILYVTDPLSDEIIVIDRGHNNAIENRIPVGRLPRSIVFTPNGDKAYVSNEGPIPQGSISVIDARKHRILRTIKGVNTPEGLAIDPVNHRVYVASQSGYGEDPVFVIDTVEDKVLEDETIREMAVGVGVAVSSKHHKLYVARGNFPYSQPSGHTGSPLSIIDLASRRELKRYALQTSVNLAVLTPDEEYVLIGNADQVSIVDTSSDLMVKTFRFEAPVIGIAVSRENAVYVLLPGLQVKMLGLSGLISKTTRSIESSIPEFDPSRRELLRQFEAIRSTILHTNIVNRLFPVLHRLREFFDTYSELLVTEENEAFYQKWLMHPMVETGEAAISSMGTAQSVEELRSELRGINLHENDRLPGTNDASGSSRGWVAEHLERQSDSRSHFQQSRDQFPSTWEGVVAAIRADILRLNESGYKLEVKGGSTILQVCPQGEIGALVVLELDQQRGRIQYTCPVPPHRAGVPRIGYFELRMDTIIGQRQPDGSMEPFSAEQVSEFLLKPAISQIRY